MKAHAPSSKFRLGDDLMLSEQVPVVSESSCFNTGIMKEASKLWVSSLHKVEHRNSFCRKSFELEEPVCLIMIRFSEGSLLKVNYNCKEQWLFFVFSDVINNKEQWNSNETQEKRDCLWREKLVQSLHVDISWEKSKKKWYSEADVLGVAKMVNYRHTGFRTYF